MSSYDEVMSAKALVAHRQIHSDCGGATIFCVILADGFIVECGSDGYSQRRAKLLAEAVNLLGPELFLKQGMTAAACGQPVDGSP